MLFNIYGASNNTGTIPRQATATTATLSIGPTSAQIFPADANRIEWLINNQTTNTALLYLGYGSQTVTSANAPVIVGPGQFWRQNGESARAEVRGFTASGTQSYGSSQITYI